MTAGASYRPAAETLGVLDLPEPLHALAARRWDVIIVGAGHNGLACAAYLARAGKRVLVLEARERVGGACTLEEVWPGYRISPCAYLAGLLHPRVIEELDLPGRGFEWYPATAGLFVPFEDGSSVQLWDDDAQCEAEVGRLAPADVAGWRELCAVKRRLRDALRPPGDGDLWLGRAPSREQIDERLGRDDDVRRLLFEWSMVEFVEHYLRDERLQIALLGQGVIGTNASPFDPGDGLDPLPPRLGAAGRDARHVGLRQGRDGHSFLPPLRRRTRFGAVVAAGVPVARIVPGQGVELEAGERIDAPVVVVNADPRVALRLLGDAADPGWQERVLAVPMTGCTVKLNVALSALPDFQARPGTRREHHLGQVNTPLTKPEWQAGFAAARAGRLPERLWTELYFQTAHDRSVAPAGIETMSVFAQYVPYAFATGTGDWATRRQEVTDLALAAIGRFCGNIPDAVLAAETLGPPDIERKVGLTGGHIFQGECLPDFMWSRRLDYRTPMPGVFLCGAATYPGGSVIAVNGRNAALEVLGVLSS